MSHLRLVPALAAGVLLAACSDGLRTPVESSPRLPPSAPALAVSAYAGTIVVNEVMVDPSAVSDTDGEWIEVHNRGTTTVNLQGWVLASNNDTPHTIASSLPVAPGGFVVLARNASSGTNGGVTVAYAYGALTLANGSDWVALRDGGGASVDSVTWASTMPAGYTRGVTDPDSDNLNAQGANWHTSAVTYGSGDRGTPGAQNDGRRSELKVRVLEVGQGDAIYVTNGSSRVLIDGGPSQTRMEDLIDEFGLSGKRIDLMILTHGHADHLAGLREFFKTANDVDVSIFLENKDSNSGTTITALRDSVNARALRSELDYRDTDDPCGTGAARCTFLLDGGAKIHILRPKPTDSNANNRSVAVKIVGPDSASFTFFAAGDAEHGALVYFDSTADYDLTPGINVDVLKAGHHGSCNGISSRLLDMTTPSYVTMGVGSSNTYGHVHTQTTGLLSGRSIPWLRTDENGRITFTSPGTASGGYSVAYERGSSSMYGDSDAASLDDDCDNL